MTAKLRTAQEPARDVPYRDAQWLELRESVLLQIRVDGVIVYEKRVPANRTFKGRVILEGAMFQLRGLVSR